MDAVLDISSDEEGWRETRAGGGGAGGDDYDWISELLGKVDTDVDDADEVVVVGDVVLNTKPRLKSSSVVEKTSVKDLDDDCVVLDGDPDKPVVIENNTASDSDELLIVGAKGQIACRDYPHPRHLCANFPFTSTPHERHCHQCHCYVCDSLAPCVHWGTGTSSINHCHATDKDEFWKLQRRNFKQGDEAPLSVPKLPDASLSMGAPQAIQVPPLTLQQPLSVAQNQVSRPTAIRACSTSANFGTLNITNHGRSQQSGFVVPRNKFSPHLVSQQLLGTRIRRDRTHNVGNLGPQFINPHAIFKRSGSAGVALMTDRSGYSSSNSNYVNRYLRSPSPMEASNDKNPSSWQDFSSGMISDSNAYQAPYLQTPGSSFVNSVPSHPRVSSHPDMGSIFVNSMPYHPQVSSQPSIGNSFVNSLPSPQASSQPSMCSNFENSVPSQPQAYCQPNMGSSFVHPVPSQLGVYSQLIPASEDAQDGFQQGNEAQNALNPDFPGFNPNCVTPTGQNNQQPSENSQIQSAGPTYHPSLLPEFDPQVPVNTNPGSLAFPFPFDCWMLDNQSAYSPGPATVDPGFFDF